MRIELDSDWTYQGFQVMRLTAGDLRVEVLPELGGKVLSIFHLGLRREFLWRNPRLRLRRLPIGSGYDDHFAGGFDELLPNDLPEKVGGEPLADHGELWTLPLAGRIEGEALVLEGDLPVTPLRYRRSLSIVPPETIRLDYRIENRGGRDVDFLWKLHPALRITEGARVEVPARRAEVGDPAFSRFGAHPEFPWPEGRDSGGRPLRADIVPSLASRSAEFLYLTGLERGAAALVHPGEGWAFRMEFPADVFRSVWVFASYRGWREHEVLILEPSTAWPISLNEAAARGQASRLAPGQVLEAGVTLHAGRA